MIVADEQVPVTLDGYLAVCADVLKYAWDAKSNVYVPVCNGAARFH
jgi:hypothetical protein